MGMVSGSPLGGLGAADVPLLRGLTALEVGTVVGAAARDDIAVGTKLLVEGERRDEVFVVLAGSVRVSVRTDHGERALGDLGPGTCVGEMSIVTNEPASATVTALTPCRVIRIGRAAFERALAEIPALGRNLGAILAQRLRDTSRRTTAARGCVLPIVVTAGQLARARRAASWIAASIARQLRGHTLVVDLHGGTPASDLPSLADLAHYPARIVHHERAARATGADTHAIDGSRVDAALTEDLVTALCALYPFVIVVMPAGGAALARLGPLAKRAFAVVDHGDPAGERAAIASALGTVSVERVRLLAFAPPGGGGRRAELELARRHDCAAATIIAGRDGDDIAPPTIDRIARDVAGIAVGIALGAGGTRGFAHVGVLETLVGAGVPFDYIAGTSIGSIVGALWAFGHTPDEILALLAETRRHVVKLTLPTRSLLSNRGIRGHIDRNAKGRSIEDAAIPLAVVAADIHDGGRVVMTTGPVAPALLASSSIPGVFPPVWLGGRHLVDGGICEPVPTTTVAELGAQIIIGVTLGRRARALERRPYNMLSTLLRMNEIMQQLVNNQTAVQSHVLIAPKLDLGPLDFPDRATIERLRAAGRAAAEQALPELRSLLPWLGPRRPA